MIKNMRKGSVVLDMAVEYGGNCEISELGKTATKYGVKIIGEPNIPSLVAVHASELYSKNIYNLLMHISKNANLNLNIEDEIVKGSLITFNGAVVHERTKQLLK